MPFSRCVCMLHLHVDDQRIEPLRIFLLTVAVELQNCCCCCCCCRRRRRHHHHFHHFYHCYCFATTYVIQEEDITVDSGITGLPVIG